MVKFGDVVKNVNSVERGPEAAGIERIVGLDHLDPGNLHIRRWDTPGKGTSFTRKFTPGQTLFGKRRAYQHKVAYAEFEGICSGDILTFEPKNKTILLPELLPFICQTDAFFEHALGTSAGSLSPRTNWGALSAFEFALPPIEEQKRIAAVLWAADESAERWRDVLRDSSHVLGSIRLRCSGYDERTLPLGWCQTTIGECCEILDSQRIPLNDEQRNGIKGTVPYYGATGVVDCINDSLFDEPLVLVAEDGGPYADYLNKPIAYFVEGRSWVNNHAHVLRAKDSRNTRWVYHLMCHRNILKYVSGTTRAKLNLSSLKQIPLPIPPTPECTRLTGQMDALVEQIRRIEIHVSALTSISRSLLNSNGVDRV